MEKIVTRAAELVGAFGVAGTMPDQVDVETQAMGSCQLIKQSMELFIKFCFAKDSNGFYRNLTSNTVIPTGVWVPWASAGKPRNSKNKRCQLTRTERSVVSAYLLFLKQNRRFPLFVYDAQSRRWTVDTLRYENEKEALNWLRVHAINAKTFVALKKRMPR